MSQLYGQMIVGEFDRLQIYVQCIGCQSCILLTRDLKLCRFMGKCEDCKIDYYADNVIEITVDDHSGNGETGFGQ